MHLAEGLRPISIVATQAEHQAEAAHIRICPSRSPCPCCVNKELHYITAQTKVKVDRLGRFNGKMVFSFQKLWKGRTRMWPESAVEAYTSQCRCESLLAGIAQHFELDMQA